LRKIRNTDIMSVVKNSEIKINVGLDAQKVPVEMKWTAPDGADGGGEREVKAMLLSLFDKEYKDTYKIDLWTNEMQVVEMDRFFYQTLRAMADTYYKATQNKDLAVDMQRFVQYFGEETEIIPKSEG